MTDEQYEPAEVPWQRLHARMICVDVAQTAMSLAPVAVAVWGFGADLGSAGLWPVFAVAAVGVFGAVGDALRWVFTRYRVSDEYVELRTGVLVRSYRSVQRDRIRSVDVEARLRHRLAALRVVNIGAGQQTSTGESALALDSVSKTDAERLRRLLLGAEPSGQPALARLQPRWVLYNMFNVWAYAMALGVLWGAYWLATLVGLDVSGYVAGLLDWQALGVVWTITIGLLLVGAVGVAGLAINFFTEHWNFELTRVPGEHGTVLRTRQGLIRTREVNRDDSRMRGIQIAEPVLWRWMGMADTTVITTGLSEWSMSQPTAVLPRGPITVARPVATAVLGADSSPLETPLARHPRRALRRRLVWATTFTAVIVAVLGWLAGNDVISAGALWAGAVAWPVTLSAAVIAYRALGHGIAGAYLVVRSGLVSRATAALQRSAVSTISIRQSVLQRRLDLKTVSAMTAAGYGSYAAPDLDATEAVGFAAQAAPGLLQPFLVTDTPVGDDPSRSAV